MVGERIRQRRKELGYSLRALGIRTNLTASFLSQVSESYGPGTLQRLARHAEREVRRAAVLALGLLGDYEANHTLGCALLDNDRTVRTLAENAIRTIWTRAGDQRQRQELGVIIRLNAAQQHKEAIVRASRLICLLYTSPSPRD